MHRYPPFVLHQINGFMGIIGPDIIIPATASSNHTQPVKTLYELFTGDGMIQGVFFDGEGQFYPIKEIIETEKRQFENNHGKMPTNILFSLFTYFLYKIHLAPNLLGFANTALGWFDSRLYAFYERDMPYLLDIDFENRRIRTSKRIHLENVEMCSGHTKENKETNSIDTIEYNVYNKKVNYYSIDIAFQRILKKCSIQTTNIPIIHDFHVLRDPNRILFFDSPFRFNISLFLQSKIPVSFHTKGKTYIRIKSVDSAAATTNSKEEIYCIEQGIALFHFAKVFETEDYLEITASLYDNICFDSLSINGKFRKIIIDKHTKNVTININPELEKYNLDFPILWKNIDGYEKFERVILRNFDGERNNGFVFVEDFTIIKEIFFDKFSISGEPVIVEGKHGSQYLLTLAYDDNMSGYLIAVHLNTMKIEEICLGMNITIGFHSIFIPN